jgi:predicted transcriptional regulator of viral defense system
VPSTIDRLYPIAERQLGYFTTAQAAEQEVSRQLLQKHLHYGAITRIWHGIYRLNNFPVAPFEDVMTATLMAGPLAVASHETALAIYGISDAMPANIHITTPDRFRTKRPGLIAHIARLDDAERTRRNGIPVTTVERTLVDVARRSDLTIARGALDDALKDGETTVRRINKQLARTDSPILDRLLEEMK